MIEDTLTQQYITSRYQVLVEEKNLWAVNLYDKRDPIGSAVVCRRMVVSDLNLIKVNFHSQINIEPKNRGKGYLSKLITGLDQIDRDTESGVSIVIARKAVGDLYFKYGYVVASKFSIVEIEGIFSCVSNIEIIPPRIDRIKVAYEFSYKNQYSYFFRSEELWQGILQNFPSNNLQISSGTLNGSYWYFIVSSGEIVELACEDLETFPGIVDYLISIGMNKLRINDKHPAYKYLLARKGVLRVRPEYREGHMLKINTQTSSDFDKKRNQLVLSNLIETMNLDILLLDHW